MGMGIGDRIILVNQVIGDLVKSVISAYAPQFGLDMSSKGKFRVELQDMVRSLSRNEKLFI